jgi:hypothetical protein
MHQVYSVDNEESSLLGCGSVYVLTDVSEERIVSIFRVEEKRRKNQRKQVLTD